MAPVGGPPSAVEFLLTLTRAILALQLTLVPANLAPQRPLPLLRAWRSFMHCDFYPGLRFRSLTSTPHALLASNN
jgi:hypothetical protein